MKTAKPSIQSLLDCARQFYDRQWMWGTSGNLSIKLKQSPLEIAITPTGINKGHMTLNDLLTIKGTGDKMKISKPTGRSHLMPSAETVIHQTIHETLPGCGAVFHVHAMHATLISGLYGNPKQRQMLRVEWFETMKGVGVGEEESADIAIIPNWQDVSLIARDIKQYLQETPKALPCVLVYNHGLTGWGRTPEEARNHLEIFEYVCKYLYLKRLMTKA